MSKEKEIIPKKEEAKPSNIPSGYEKQEDANFIRFEEIGDSVQGKLMETELSNRYGFKLYSIKSGNDMLRFHGSQQLDSLLMKAEIGDNIFVEYIDSTETPNGTMKIFDVGIQKKK